MMLTRKWGRHQRVMGKWTAKETGFTLIELLIVVAIIGVLGSVAIPNFLAAQVRAKVARVKADLDAVNTCLENYRIDQSDYPPNDGVFNVLPVNITTPISYVTDSMLIDPFSSHLEHPVYGQLARFYTYTKIVSFDELVALANSGSPIPPAEGVDAPMFNLGAFSKYGEWRLVSNGPDQVYSDKEMFVTDSPVFGSDILYDPTNGTTSWGNILRTHKSAKGRI